MTCKSRSKQNAPLFKRMQAVDAGYWPTIQFTKTHNLHLNALFARGVSTLPRTWPGGRQGSMEL